MGQKVNPITFRLGVTREHDAIWYADKRKYASVLYSDIEARAYILKKFPKASINAIFIARPAGNARITIKSSQPAGLIGKKGADIIDLKEKVSKIMGVPVHINIEEIKKPDIYAYLVAKNIAQQLEKRVSFRRAMKKAISSALRQGAKGIKISISGRLGGAEIARTEKMREGRVPLHTLRADIDYGLYEAKTTAGIIGVKVWIYKGDFSKQEKEKVVH